MANGGRCKGIQFGTFAPSPDSVKALDRTSVEAAVRLMTGRPELVVVDERVLRLLMGDLAGLIILGRVEGVNERAIRGADGEEPYAWDHPEPCGG